MKNSTYEGKNLYEQEDETAIQCATEQATTDLVDLEVIDANVSSRIDPLAHAHVCFQRPHQYVHVTMYQRSNGSEIHALYRVWHAEGAWKAAHVGQILPKRERCRMRHLQVI